MTRWNRYLFGGNIQNCGLMSRAMFLYFQTLTFKGYFKFNVAQCTYAFLPRDADASALLVIVIMSVRPSHEWFVTKPKNTMPVF